MEEDHLVKVRVREQARVRGENHFRERPVSKAYHLKAAATSDVLIAPALGMAGAVAPTLRYLESNANASSALSLDTSALTALAKHSALRGESQLELKAQMHPPQNLRGP